MRRDLSRVMADASCWMFLSNDRMARIWPGSSWRPSMIELRRSAREIRSSESWSAIMTRAMYWEVYACRLQVGQYSSLTKEAFGHYTQYLRKSRKRRPTLVLATPISGPALIWIPQWDSLEIVDPTTLTTPTLRAPRSMQYLIARIVSAVSPDWETKMHVSSLKIGVLRSRKSDASSTETGISVNSSKMARVCFLTWRHRDHKVGNFQYQFSLVLRHGEKGKEGFSNSPPSKNGMKYHKQQRRFSYISSWQEDNFSIHQG